MKDLDFEYKIISINYKHKNGVMYSVHTKYGILNIISGIQLSNKLLKKEVVGAIKQKFEK